ncbi:WG repeat-containing protein [uncultured Ruthenibacterium sp.]|uniref:WG repeat-containing protein n=1 Tax=uncultured Ruthenibacterium sp. TaxID=1905347 RepID=UPI00349ECF78
MKHPLMRLVCTGLLSAFLLTACGQTGQPVASGSSQSSTSSAGQTVQMERTPVLDMQYADLLSRFDIVGSFHNGVAFAARCLPMTEQDFVKESISPDIECGYITLDGEYTPLYTVPDETELLGPSGVGNNLHGDYDVIFQTTQEFSLILMSHSALIGADTGFWSDSAPFPSEQKQIDDAFLVGENGWVPYFEDGKWGYCDLEGNVKLEPSYDFVLPFSAGKALVCHYDNELYSWLVIDESGAQLAAFEPTEGFALRKMGSEFVFMQRWGTGQMYRLDGTPLSEYHNFDITYLDQDGYALQDGTVYDASGALYQSEDLVPVGVQDGCAVYREGTRYGIRGSDGAVRCEARFTEICRLAPEGFYARENSNQVNLYDYDGNLLEQAPACIRVVQCTDGFLLYDGKGQLVKTFRAPSIELPNYQMNGDTFFTEDGFLYLHLSETEFVTLHITFEDQPVQEVPETSVTFPDGATLTVQTGEPFEAKSLSMVDDTAYLYDSDALVFVNWDFDSRKAVDKCAIVEGRTCSEGLEWYETPSHQILVCDESFQTVFTVPQEGLNLVQAGAGNVEIDLRYAGEGLWVIALRGENNAQICYVFDREGSIVLEDTQAASAGANEGYFFLTGQWDRFYTLEGEPVEIQPQGEETVEVYSLSMFDGGLANTIYGYVDSQGTVVLSADQILQNIRAYLQMSDESYFDLVALCPFEDEQATVYAVLPNLEPTSDYDGSIYHALRIDRTGKVTGSSNFSQYKYDLGLFPRFDEVKEEIFDTPPQDRFYLCEDSVSKLFTSNGTEVATPEGMEFQDGLVQWDPRFAFVETSISNQGRQYLLVDAAGKVYTELAQGWDDVYASPNGMAYGVKIIRNEDQSVDCYQLTPLTITVS